MVQGLAQMQARWSRIPVVVRDEVRQAMEKMAYEIITDMYNAAPQDTGDLAGSIDWTWGAAPKDSIMLGQVGGGPAYATLQLTIFAGNGETFYARFQEFGTVNMAANPFFYPIWRIWKRRARSRIAAAIRRGIKRAA